MEIHGPSSPDVAKNVKVQVKKENINNDVIKEFAESTMNELLGWYGYSPRNDLRNNNFRTYSRSDSSSPESTKLLDKCGWCSKIVEETKSICSSSTVFCSEMCFSQSRRASFKKSKTCDWCRHVRHTVSYVDFQDGESQLQFCSDKCLNQYKMHIFCRETRAHLEMHPHLQSEPTTTGTLITPDLWLKNCKSPESRSPSPRNTTPSPESHIQVSHTSTSSRPTTSILEGRKTRRIHRRCKKRLPSASISSPRISMNEIPQDLRMRSCVSVGDDVAPRINLQVENSEDARDESPKLVPNFEPNPRLIDPRYFTGPPPAFPAIRRPMDLVPPPTILVPYPLVLPLPIPIPIPIPISGLKTARECSDETTQTDFDTGSDIASQKIGEVDGKAAEDKKDEEEKLEVEEVVNVRPLRKRKRMPEKIKIVKNKT